MVRRDAEEIADASAPLLVVHGEADVVLPIEGSAQLVERLGGPTWFVTLAGGSHSAPFSDEPSPFDDRMADWTAAFWAAEFDGDEAARDRMVSEAAAAEDTTIAVSSS